MKTYKQIIILFIILLFLLFISGSNSSTTFTSDSIKTNVNLVDVYLLALESMIPIDESYEALKEMGMEIR